MVVKMTRFVEVVSDGDLLPDSHLEQVLSHCQPSTSHQTSYIHVI